MANIFKSASPIRVGNFPSAPADVSAGALYWDTVAMALYVADGTSYSPVGGGSVSFPLSGPNGTAAAPTYGLTSGSGIYGFAANSLGFATNGITAGHIDSSRNWVFAGPLNFNSQQIKWNDAVIITNAGDPVSLTNTITNANNGQAFNTYPYINLVLTGSATAANQPDLSFPAGLKSCKIDYVIYDTTSTNRRIGTMYAVCDAAIGNTATLVSIVDTNTETGNVGVTWTAALASNQIQFYYTTTAGNKNMSAIQTIYAVQT